MYFVMMQQFGENRPVLMTNEDLLDESDYEINQSEWAAMFNTIEEANKAAQDSTLCRGNGYRIGKW